MSTKLTKYIIAITIQIMIILFIIIFKYSILSGGTEVILKIRPVDPRDFLRGDYVTFQYDISSLPYYLALSPINNQDTVYVELYNMRSSWSATKIHKNHPKDGKIYIKAKVISGGNDRNNSNLNPRYRDYSQIELIYGIEQYFIPEGKGKNFSFNNKDSFAKVMIDDQGNAVLKQIYVDDQPWP